MLVHQERKINEQEIVREGAEESIVSLEDAGGKGRGTGWVARAKSGKKVIMTNAHICEMNPVAPIFVVYHRSKGSVRYPIKFPAIAIKKDDKQDLCMVSVPPDLKADPLPLADAVYLDSKIYIIGYPIEPLLSVSSGNIRGSTLVDNPYDIPLELCKGKKFHIETVPIEQENGETIKKTMCFLKAKFTFSDALSDHGASGSPVLDGDGDVVGVMSMIGGQARPFAIFVPLAALKEFLSTY
jgi:S1-C subfamily serine protease